MDSETTTQPQSVFWRPSAPLRVATGTSPHHRLAVTIVAAILASVLTLLDAGTATAATNPGPGTRVAAQTLLTPPLVGAETPGSPVFVGETTTAGYDFVLVSRVAPTSALDDAFQAPGTVVNRHGQLTNGTYTLDASGMAPHQVGSLGSDKSQFFSTVDADTAVLDAAAYADEAGLWVGNRAKVYVENGPVGALATTGEPTQWINVYRTNTGFVHGTPGTPP